MIQRILIGLLALMLPAAPALANDINAAQAFTKLVSLEGDWRRKEAPESKLTIRFERTAGGTTLMETWLSGTKPHSLTVYHLDGDALIATHYCPQGNQPRLKMKPSVSANTIEFDYWDATNLKSLDHNHQHGLSFDLSDIEKTLVRGETYLSKDGPDVSELVLVRVKEPYSKTAR